MGSVCGVHAWGCSGHAARVAADVRLQFGLHPGVGPAAGSQIPGCAAEGEGDCWDPSSFGATLGRDPQQNTSSSLFPAKALSNGGRGRGRRKEAA